MRSQHRNDWHRDADFEVESRPVIGRLNGLRLIPDFETSPDLWSLQGDIPWDDPPLSHSLRRRVDDWHEVWEQNCYFNRDRWKDKDVCRTWEAQGWVLWALINRELVPQNWIVKPDFAGYGKRYRRTKRSANRRSAHRFYRPVSAHQARLILDHSNSILRHNDERTIEPLVRHVPLSSPRRRRHWR